MIGLDTAGLWDSKGVDASWGGTGVARRRRMRGAALYRLRCVMGLIYCGSFSIALFFGPPGSCRWRIARHYGTSDPIAYEEMTTRYKRRRGSSRSSGSSNDDVEYVDAYTTDSARDCGRRTARALREIAQFGYDVLKKFGVVRGREHEQYASTMREHCNVHIA